MLKRTIIMLALLVSLVCRGAETPAEIAFKAAVRAFEDQLYDRAHEQFTEFTRTHTESDLLSSARAFALRSQAHSLAKKKDHPAAAKSFRELRLQFPNSPNHLEFVVGEAWSEYHQKNLDTVVTLLGNEESPFQLAETIRPNDPIALPLLVSGRLLLAQTYLDQEQYEAASEALENVTDWDLRSEFSWRRRLIITRLHLAKNELALARQNAEFLLELADARENREWIAESAAVLGEVRIANDQPEAAIVAYKRNLAPGTPKHRHREAWLKIVSLEKQQRDAQSVIEQLNEFIQLSSENDDALDIALLTLGELNLERFYEENIKPERPDDETTPSATEYLNEAILILERLIKDYPESPLLAQAQYHRGWCYWELGEANESVEAFQLAADLLPPEGREAATARFKLADGFYVMGRYPEALENYTRIIETYENDPQIKESFLDQVLYQTVRAAVVAADMDAARAAINKLTAYYPDNLQANTGRLLMGQHYIHINNVSDAREVFFEMIEHFTDFPLKPEVYYAIAYTFELEGKWESAAAQYASWIEEYPEHSHRVRATYALAWCTSQQGKHEEALEMFRNFIRDDGEHELANVARLWLGNYYFNRQNFETAERHYGVILKTTTPAQEDLRQRAGLMAGRASFRRQQYAKAILHLTQLSEQIQDNESVSPSFKAEVELNLGDALFERGKRDSSQLDSIGNARLKFAKVAALHQDSRLAAIGWGRYGDASYYLKDYPEAVEVYQEVISLDAADIAIRSQAEVALGMTYERQAELAREQSRTAEADTLLNRALQHYLNVVYLKNLRENENPDPFWLEEAGIKAGVLVEASQDLEIGIKLYQRLAELLPPLREDWDRLRMALEAKRKG